MASTASWNFMWSLMEWPTTRVEPRLSSVQRQSLPSSVVCSVVSVSHNLFRALAMKSCSTRTSCACGHGFFHFLPCPDCVLQPLAEEVAQMFRSAA